MSKEILNLILNEIKEIRIEMTGIKDEQHGMKHEQREMKDEISSIKLGQHEMKDEISSIKVGQHEMKDEISSIKVEQLSMKAQIEENTQLLKAVIHRQDEFDAKVDGLTLNVAKIHGEVTAVKEGLTELAEDQKSVFEIIGEHEISIRTLRGRPV